MLTLVGIKETAWGASCSQLFSKPSESLVSTSFQIDFALDFKQEAVNRGLNMPFPGDLQNLSFTNVQGHNTGGLSDLKLKNVLLNFPSICSLHNLRFQWAVALKR